VSMCVCVCVCVRVRGGRGGKGRGGLAGGRLYRGAEFNGEWRAVISRQSLALVPLGRVLIQYLRRPAYPLSHPPPLPPNYRPTTPKTTHQTTHQLPPFRRAFSSFVAKSLRPAMSFSSAALNYYSRPRRNEAPIVESVCTSSNRVYTSIYLVAMLPSCVFSFFLNCLKRHAFCHY
jgi:hypothetical protein